MPGMWSGGAVKNAPTQSRPGCFLYAVRAWHEAMRSISRTVTAASSGEGPAAGIFSGKNVTMRSASDSFPCAHSAPTASETKLFVTENMRCSAPADHGAQ